jgi:hypothetical protein
MYRRLPCGLLACGLLVSGCKHRVWVDSVPAGASLTVNGELMGSTPKEIEVVWSPLSELELTVQAQGYRPMNVDLSDDLSMGRIFAEILGLRWRRLTGRAVRTEHELIFIREHGSSGTWLPEDARRN